LGWAEICHPFHPLKGQRFLVVKERRVAGVDTLWLRSSERGGFAVPKEWTDRAAPSAYDAVGIAPRRFDVVCLLELVALVEQLSTQSHEGLAK
jgi:hypothetical protein